MKYIISSILIGLLGYSFALADTKADFSISSAGEVHFIGADLLRKHASNLYTVETWGFRWLTNIPYGTKIESMYGAPVAPEDVQEGHLLDMTGKLVLQDSIYQIEAVYIKDLSITTGTPPPPPAPISPPTPLPPTPKPAPAPEVKKIPVAASQGLTMNLKNGYRGGQVTILQKFLKKQNILDDGSVTGIFGQSTEDALKKFQEANALEASGTTGPKTRTLINSLLVK